MDKRKMFPRLADLRQVKIIEVIQVKRVIGEGIDEDPARIIWEYYTFDGKLLARNDDWAVRIKDEDD